MFLLLVKVANGRPFRRFASSNPCYLARWVRLFELLNPLGRKNAVCCCIEPPILVFVYRMTTLLSQQFHNLHLWHLSTGRYNRSQLMPAPTEMSSSMSLGIVNTLASTQPNVARTVVEVTCRFLRLVLKYTAVLPAPAPRVKNVPILSGLPCGKVDTLFTISTMPLGKLSHSLSYVGLSGM